MCTLSIISTDNKIIVTMNRDESRQRHERNIITRKENLCGDIKVLFPVDEKSKGTWIGSNNKGVLLALLNRYQDSQNEKPASRGEIIPKALAEGALNKVLNYCCHLDVHSYKPFDLLLISEYFCYRFIWDGLTYQKVAIDCSKNYFISSSSANSKDVLEWRNQYFQQYMARTTTNTINEKQILNDIHLQQDVNNKNRSIFMSREHTHTKSISQVIITSSSLDFNYFPEVSLVQRDTKNEIEVLHKQVVQISIN